MAGAPSRAPPRPHTYESHPMSSIRQVDANKRNGALSRGPTSEEGKRISRGNAVKLGLSGQGIALSEPDAAKVEQRLPAWCEAFAPNNEQD